ncbi:YhgE/Pip domain-containing protein [Cohnella sp. AR92]|uniref:YhgE/Pip domain-containing protein n=1 Tax=Cohnella sp. AR92 TaxID=648716 RepID=UPI000F8C888B|nr:ABC transporter permease [Cohnella sp. AR92]RUS47286.1 ABC transporter permease [Cohnella sp. AR92]
MRRLLAIKIAWFPVWVVAVLMMAMISVYLPVFSGGTQRVHDFPLVIANEDPAFAESAIGQKITQQLTTTSGDKIHWTLEKSKQDALDTIEKDKAFGALVIPAGFSDALAKLDASLKAGDANVEPVPLEILINEGSGQLSTSVASATLQQIAASLTSAYSAQMSAELSANGITVTPAGAALLENPIRTTTANALGLPANLNKGMTPFVLTIILSIGGLMGTQMIHGFLSKIVESIKARGGRLSRTTVLATEFLLGLALILGISILAQLFVFGIFGSVHTAALWKIFLFTLLCQLTMFFLFKTVTLIFGGKWAMLAMFPINILGIFASGGAIALTGLPAFHRFCSYFLPTRYMVDGFRSLLYYNGKMESGLGLALIVIVTYLAVFLSFCIAKFFLAHHQDKNDKAAKPEAAPQAHAAAASHA